MQESSLTTTSCLLISWPRLKHQRISTSKADFAGLRHTLNASNLSSQSNARANKLLGFVKRSTRHKQSTIVRRSVYLTIVRPHLGYATQVWAPHITHALHYRMILFGWNSIWLQGIEPNVWNLLYDKLFSASEKSAFLVSDEPSLPLIT